MSNLSFDFPLEEQNEFTKEQKIKLMQFAMFDKEFIERCNDVQSEMENLNAE